MRSGPWVLLLLLAAAGAAIPSLTGLRFDHDTRSLLRADTESDALERTLTERFGSDDILLLAWEVPDLPVFPNLAVVHGYEHKLGVVAASMFLACSILRTLSGGLAPRLEALSTGIAGFLAALTSWVAID